MGALFAWIEGTGVATAVANSATLTASLSAVHVIGFTLVTGGALVANLRALGVLLSQRPAVDVVTPANRVILLGLAISLLTGALLFSARATTVSANGTFQLKMLLLVSAALFHFTVHRRASVHANTVAMARAAGALGVSLWFGLAVTACAFILLE
jgi:hypothetical protein